MPDVVFSNIGKLLLSTQIYDMHRIAHQVSGGLIVSLPGPDEDHNPVTGAKLADVLRGRPDIPYDKRIEVARFIEDLTASSQAGWYSVISLHGGGSPEAMKKEIFRNYPLGNKVDLVERLLERGVLADPERKITRNRQPGACCDSGCMPVLPAAPQMVPLPKTSDARRKARPVTAKSIAESKAANTSKRAKASKSAKTSKPVSAKPAGK
jgi:4-hydroxybutyryl-CoA dehydratase/vinylacetyl-CoA-Delta-isomerase